MKTIGTILLFCLLLPFFVAGQGNSRQARLIEAKAALMRSELNLSAEQEEAFLPLYTSYEKEIAASSAPMRSLRNRMRADTVTYGPVPTREQALLQIRTGFRVSQSILDVKKRYLDRFALVLDPGQLLKFYQTENAIRNRINRELKRRNNP